MIHIGSKQNPLAGKTAGGFLYEMFSLLPADNAVFRGVVPFIAPVYNCRMAKDIS